MIVGPIVKKSELENNTTLVKGTTFIRLQRLSAEVRWLLTVANTNL